MDFTCSLCKLTLNDLIAVQHHAISCLKGRAVFKATEVFKAELFPGKFAETYRLNDILEAMQEENSWKVLTEEQRESLVSFAEGLNAGLTAKISFLKHRKSKKENFTAIKFKEDCFEKGFELTTFNPNEREDKRRGTPRRITGA